MAIPKDRMSIQVRAAGAETTRTITISDINLSDENLDNIRNALMGTYPEGNGDETMKALSAMFGTGAGEQIVPTGQMQYDFSKASNVSGEVRAVYINDITDISEA